MAKSPDKENIEQALKYLAEARRKLDIVLERSVFATGETAKLAGEVVSHIEDADDVLRHGF